MKSKIDKITDNIWKKCLHSKKIPVKGECDEQKEDRRNLRKCHDENKTNVVSMFFCWQRTCCMRIIEASEANYCFREKIQNDNGGGGGGPSTVTLTFNVFVEHIDMR